MTSRAGTVLGLLLGAALLVGCGNDPPVSAAAGAVLTSDVARLKAAATSGTSAEVAQAAERLRADVEAQRVRGDLSSARAAAVLDQLARVLADTAARPTPTPTPTKESTPAAPRAGHDKHKGKGDH
jgi:hypothetical protein